MTKGAFIWLKQYVLFGLMNFLVYALNSIRNRD